MPKARSAARHRFQAADSGNGLEVEKQVVKRAAPTTSSKLRLRASVSRRRQSGSRDCDLLFHRDWHCVCGTTAVVAARFVKRAVFRGRLLIIATERIGHRDDHHKNSKACRFTRCRRRDSRAAHKSEDSRRRSPPRGMSFLAVDSHPSNHSTSRVGSASLFDLSVRFGPTT